MIDALKSPADGNERMGIKYHSPGVNRRVTKQMVDDYGAIVSTLTEFFGSQSLEHVQKTCDNAFGKAKARWAKEGIPPDPRAAVWNEITENSSELFCRKINYLSGENGREKKLDLSAFNPAFPEKKKAVKSQIELLFSLSSPLIEDSVRKPLTLNVLFGFSCSSLASILGKSEKSLSREFAREKEKIASGVVAFEKPGEGKNAGKKLQAVMRIVSGIFDLGRRGSGNDPAAARLCECAIKLGELLCDFPPTRKPATHALLSFMLLTAARKGTADYADGKNRSDDRNRNADMTKRGFEHLHMSAEGGSEVTEIHLKAGVAAVHSLAKKYGDEKWDRIISLYDNYLACRHCPVTELRKAIAISKKRGPREGIEAIREIEKTEELESNYLLYSTLGNLHFELHSYEDAISNFRRASGLAAETFEKDFYSKKIKICEDRIVMSRRTGRGVAAL